MNRVDVLHWLFLSDYIIEKEPLVNKFISVPTEGGKWVINVNIVFNWRVHLNNVLSVAFYFEGSAKTLQYSVKQRIRWGEWFHIDDYFMH